MAACGHGGIVSKPNCGDCCCSRNRKPSVGLTELLGCYHGRSQTENEETRFHLAGGSRTARSTSQALAPNISIWHILSGRSTSLASETWAEEVEGAGVALFCSPARASQISPYLLLHRILNRPYAFLGSGRVED